MAQFSERADANDQYTGYESLPAGEYKVQIADTDIITTKKGDGTMLKIVYEVVADPKFEGRKIFDNIMIEHPSVEACRIGRQKRNTIYAVTGITAIKDTAQMHGKTLTLLLGVKANADANGNDQNFIKKYLPFNLNGDYEEENESQATSTKKPSFIKR